MQCTLPTLDEVWQRTSRQTFLSQCQTLPDATHFLVGCSGGVDSIALLHFLIQHSPFPLRAIYINHQLQAPAAEWGHFVTDFCQQHGVPCIVQSVNVASGNLEAQARQARYAAFAQHAAPHDYVVLAHHQQDQAETLLLRLFSGAGVQGLAAMSTFDHHHGLNLFRPFLNWSRQHIEAYAALHQLPFVDDPTNHDPDYDRAWARCELWPLLQQRFPKMQQAVARASTLLQDAHEILEEVCRDDQARVVQADGRLDLTQLAMLSQARQRQLLSRWMQGDAAYRPSLAMVERLQREVIDSRADAQASVHWNQMTFRRYRDALYRIAADEEIDDQMASSTHMVMQLQQPYAVLAGQYVNTIARMGLDPALLGQALNLQQRQGGEKVHLYGRVGHWPLKKAIQDAHIAPWQRQRIQILSKDNVILGVFTPQGFWLAQSPYCCDNGWLPQLRFEQGE